MKNSADLGGCYPPRPSALVDNTLLDLQNSSYPTQPHSMIVKYLMRNNNDYARPARAFYTSVHFFAVIVMTTTSPSA